jgi:hypothetical protein
MKKTQGAIAVVSDDWEALERYSEKLGGLLNEWEVHEFPFASEFFRKLEEENLAGGGAYRGVVVDLVTEEFTNEEFQAKWAALPEESRRALVWVHGYEFQRPFEMTALASMIRAGLGR